MNENYVVGIGEVLWDVLPEGKKLGGAPANFACHVSRFGLNGLVISAVGKDKLGDEIINVFNQKRLEYQLEKTDFPTGTVEVTLDNAGVPQYDIKENVAWDNIPFTERIRQIASRTQAVCFGSLAQRSQNSRRSINAFLDSMPDSEDGLKVFDINLRQNFYSEEIVRESLSKCNILKINDEELLIVKDLLSLRGRSQEELCNELMALGNLRMLILTCGTKGSMVFSQEGISVLGTPTVQVADTVGAGDSFTAAFISSLIKGKTVREAHQTAVNVSAYVCTQQGAMPPLPKSLTE